ncbi:uncharacterized protein N7518_000648 [Penicillium psychrosexuale]|uniref:uncharacterized protein n=1 Tax=Penicillium psychrosexuale TaxID=1002107 RepID=UPI002545A76A|nr:uncharacterized protein N7518_000648 [Penicillium psychrosexuale]KAJ5804345.1 hypothetical protein N7518_000648 [Penicillium psychrosexuale]
MLLKFSLRKTKVVPKKKATSDDLAWIQVKNGAEAAIRWLSRATNLGRSEVDEMKTELNDITTRARRDNNLPTKAMGDLTLQEVESIFKLTQVTQKNLKAGDSWDILPFDTAALNNQDVFPEFMRYLSGSRETEAWVRAWLSPLFSAVLGFAIEVGIAAAHPVRWSYEASFSHITRLGRMKLKHRLNGRPDYTLWYGEHEDLETNLVIVETKTSDEIGKGQKQVLAYMASRCRALRTKGARKKDTTVYGIVTDSRQFHFYKISKNSKWFVRTFHWGLEDSQDEEIVRILLQIIHSASTQSPMTTGRTSKASTRRRAVKRSRYSSSAS